MIFKTPNESGVLEPEHIRLEKSHAERIRNTTTIDHIRLGPQPDY